MTVGTASRLKSASRLSRGNLASATRLTRRRGIARALVDVAIARARDDGARQLWLETQSTNVTAIRAYQAMRFELIGFDDTLYDGSVAAETAMYFTRAV